MLKLLAMTLLLTTASASAAIFGRIVGAVEEGWVCTPVGSAPCNTGNNGASPTNSYVAGFVQALNSQFRDWFEYAIPDLSGETVIGASLFLEEAVVGHVGGPLTYAAYGLNGRPLMFTDVTTGNPFGSVGTSSADNSRLVEVPLNAAALAAILAAQGGSIFIGGIDSGELSSADARDFSGPAGTPAELFLFEPEPGQATPEPTSVALLATALGSIGLKLRKMRTKRGK